MLRDYEQINTHDYPRLAPRIHARRIATAWRRRRIDAGDGAILPEMTDAVRALTRETHNDTLLLARTIRRFML